MNFNGYLPPFLAAIWGQQATLRAQLAEVPVQSVLERENFESSLVKPLLSFLGTWKFYLVSLPQGEMYIVWDLFDHFSAWL